MEVDQVSDGYVRTIDDVKTVIGHAKLDSGELRPLTQVLYMGESTPDYRLLELTPEVARALREGSELVFRGKRDDRAILCTSDATFEAKEAETSNSLLLIPGLKFPAEIPAADGSDRILERKEIVGVFYEYIELRKSTPRLGRLRSLLVPYAGPELERDDDTTQSFTTESLLESGGAQMSSEELDVALRELTAFQINGRWRILEFDYHWRALSYLLNLIDENSWSLDHVPIGETLTCLGELLPKDVLNHILDMYLESTGEFSDEGEELYSLARRKVSRFCGQVLLQAASLFNLDDFMSAWQQSVPQAITVDLSDLEGIALYDRDATPPVVWHCPESDLPEDVAERFDKLFDIRPKWTLQQISPYIRRLATGKQTVNALLTKFARCSNANSTKYYSSRHRK